MENDAGVIAADSSPVEKVVECSEADSMPPREVKSRQLRPQRAAATQARDRPTACAVHEKD